MLNKICSSISEEDLYGHSALEALDTLKLYKSLYDRLNSGDVEKAIEIINGLGNNVKYFIEYIKAKK